LVITLVTFVQLQLWFIIMIGVEQLQEAVP
jgi:hypothetical protein